MPGGPNLGTDLLELAPGLLPAPLEPRYRPEDVMAVRFTSGTTGRPKGVLRRFARPPRPALLRLSPDEHLDPRLLTTAGRPFPDTGVRILDEEGAPLPPGRTGEICVRTPTAMAGYWRDPERTERVLRDGWLHTGDLGSLDAAGYLTVAGRRDHMAIVKGHNVFPHEVEEPLRSHPDVREAVMFSSSDPDRLERVHAAVAVGPGARVTEEQLRRWAREHGDVRCAPDTVLVLPAIPLNGLGKPDLPALRALAGERSGRPVTALGACEVV
ncbi:class I adenylate-forming enzyme family protein [Kitasatospora sp. NPDC053057]|uniref:class I adenylate-forming enzyme family protein n=1 Tax=Kitasatospora sp. NPDC053057 TaxID=3364062 RepID=UPI0037C981E3